MLSYKFIALLIALTFTTAKNCNSDICKNEQSFSTPKGCYCGDEAKKLDSCVKGKSPNWPFLPKKPEKTCPSPVDDAEGFRKCLDDKMPKKDPKSQEIVEECENGLTPTETGVFGSSSSISSAGITSTVGGMSIFGSAQGSCGGGMSIFGKPGKNCLKNDASKTHQSHHSKIALMVAGAATFLLF